MPRFARFRPCPALICLAAVSPALAEVVVEPREAELEAGKPLAFRVRWAGQAALETKSQFVSRIPGGDTERASLSLVPQEPLWAWSVEGCDGLIHPETGEFRAPDLDRERVFTVLATSPAGHQGRARVRVIPKGTDRPLPEHAVRRIAGDLDTPGDADGQGAQAGFRNLGGLVPWTVGKDGVQTWLAADTGNHALRVIGADGKVRTLVAGGEGKDTAARLNRPTYLALFPTFDPAGPTALVADSGNHRIRIVAADGALATLAGSERGYLDHADPLQARFDNPQGLAVGRDGTIFVADQGNRVIRAIFPDGWVRTVVGRPEGGAPGCDRAIPVEEPLVQPKALVMDDRGDILLLDGHALKRLYCEGSGQPRWAGNLLGTPDRAGFRRGWTVSLPQGPCLDHPTGLAVHGEDIWVADSGNHAVHRLTRSGDRVGSSLTTLAGTRDRGRHREGLVRDGLPEPLDGDFATLAGPGPLLPLDDGGLLVAAGTCLMRIPASSPSGRIQHLLETPLRPAEPWKVTFSLPPRLQDGSPDERPYRAWASFINLDGSLAGVCRGEGRPGQGVVAQGRFQQEGLGTLLLQTLQADGRTDSVSVRVQVSRDQAAAAAPSRIQVVPEEIVLIPGRSVPFQAQAQGAARFEAKTAMDLGAEGEEPEGWTWTAVDMDTRKPCAIGADGRFQASLRPDLKGRNISIRATSKGNRERFGEAKVVILPDTGFQDNDAKNLWKEVEGFLDWGFRGAAATGLPFMDLRAQLRFNEEAEQAPRTGAPAAILSIEREMYLNRIFAGCGQPFPLIWQPLPQATHRMLSLFPAEGPVRHEVSGLDSKELTLTASTRPTVEHLRRIGSGPQAEWTSHWQSGTVTVLGVGPGLGAQQAGHEDGSDRDARFQRPAGMTLVSGRDVAPHEVLIADTQASTLRLWRAGQVRTLCGQPDQPGAQDGVGSQASFRNPTYLAHFHPSGEDGPAWAALIADTGNHAIRKVLPNGTVTTWAGACGQPGQDDGQGGAARFRQPKGIAIDVHGTVYVADAGNHIIRRITPAGLVTTLAGSAGVPGTANGVGAEARFSDLKALAFAPDGRTGNQLWILDGHSVRLLDLASLRTSTAFGIPDQAGFLDGEVGSSNPQAPGLACLSGPSDLRFTRYSPQPDLEDQVTAVITDPGNHALRGLVLEDAGEERNYRLCTLAGDPRHAAARHGLLRSGLPAPLDDGYATLAAPGHLLELDTDQYLLTDGAEVRCATFPPGFRKGDRPIRELQAAAQPLPSPTRLPCRATFTLDLDRPTYVPPLPAGTTMAYSVEFRNPDGSLAQRRTGRGRIGGQARVDGEFDQAGDCRVLVKVLSPEGISRHEWLDVRVARAPFQALPAAGQETKVQAGGGFQAMDLSDGETAGPAGAAPLSGLDDDLEMTPAETLLETEMPEVD